MGFRRLVLVLREEGLEALVIIVEGLKKVKGEGGGGGGRVSFCSQQCGLYEKIDEERRGVI